MVTLREVLALSRRDNPVFVNWTKELEVKLLTAVREQREWIRVQLSKDMHMKQLMLQYLLENDLESRTAGASMLEVRALYL